MNIIIITINAFFVGTNFAFALHAFCDGKLPRVILFLVGSLVNLGVVIFLGIETNRKLKPFSRD